MEHLVYSLRTFRVSIRLIWKSLSFQRVSFIHTKRKKALCLLTPPERKSTVPMDQALAIPMYNNLAFFPKWQSEEDEDETADVDLSQTVMADQHGNNRKRALGRLKAKGIDVKRLRSKAGKTVEGIGKESGDLDGDIETERDVSMGL